MCNYRSRRTVIGFIAAIAFPPKSSPTRCGFIPVSLSALRMVEDMLAAREIIVSHQTVRLWAEKFGRKYGGASENFNFSPGKFHSP